VNDIGVLAWDINSVECPDEDADTATACVELQGSKKK
jgi:hypothetical protein